MWTNWATLDFHRIIKVGKTSKIMCSNHQPAPPQSPPKPIPSVTSRWFLSISRDDRDSTSSLGNLFQCLTTLTEKKTFSVKESEPLLAQLKAISPYLYTWDMAEETDPHLTTTSFKLWGQEGPLSLLLSRLNTTSSLSHFSKELFSDPSPAPLLSLGTLQHLCVLSERRGPEQDTALQVCLTRASRRAVLDGWTRWYKRSLPTLTTLQFCIASLPSTCWQCSS